MNALYYWLNDYHPHLGMHQQQQIRLVGNCYADEEDVKPLEVLGSRQAMSCGFGFECTSMDLVQELKALVLALVMPGWH